MNIITLTEIVKSVSKSKVNDEVRKRDKKNKDDDKIDHTPDKIVINPVLNTFI